MSLKTETNSAFFDDSVATFGDRIEAARCAKGLTVSKLADHLGVNEESITNWENDVVSPRANKIQMLAGVLSVSLVWLISGKSNGSDYVEKTYDRPDAVNETLNEIRSLKQVLELSLDRIKDLELRLEQAN